MPREYIQVFIFALMAVAVPGVTLILFKLIRPTSTKVGAKLQPYECGIPAESDARQRYSVRFYIVAILFVIFDVETIFLFPWALNYSHASAAISPAMAAAGATASTNSPLYVLASMFVFLGILIVGYIWLYRKGALEWV